VDSAAVHPGGYYVDEKEKRGAPEGDGPRVAAELWDASLAAVGLA